VNNGANLEQLGADARALAERVTAASTADSIEPEVTRLGDDYRVIWPARGVVLAFTGAHEGREGLRAEVSATLHGRALTSWGLVEIAKPRSRQEKAKALAEVALGLPWSVMLDQAALLVRNRLRAGEPARELQRAAMTRVRYLAHPLIIDGQVVTLFGKGGTGKSQLAHRLAKGIQAGVAIPGMTAPEFGVPAIVLDWEGSDADADALATLAATALEVETGGVHYRRLSGALVHHVAELRRLFQATGARFGVVDSMMMACGETLRDGWESSCIRFFEALRAIGDGISWLVLAHMNRADIRDPSDAMPFGSIFTVNESRAVWYALGVQDGSALTLTLTNTKINRGAIHRPLGLRLTFNDDALSVSTADPRVLATNARADLGQRLRVMLTTGALTVAEMIEATSSNDWAIRKALKRIGAIQRPDTKPIQWAMPSNRTEH
jgi:hypothetical protein